MAVRKAEYPLDRGQRHRNVTLGTPHDKEQQRRILLTTLALLAQDAPIDPILLDEEELAWDRQG